jgi:alpha-D-xyloside xylohydrolase
MRKGPYGTGNMSFGNFDFDPKFYPDPKGFIENLRAAGFDFQVRPPVFCAHSLHI